MNIADMKVLVVEDDQNTRTTIRMMLGEMGMTQVFEGKDGQAAQDFMGSGAIDIDLVISDWNMPHKTGFEFLREIRTSHPDLPFIMVSARADMNSVGDAIGAGVTSYIRKPFTLDELEQKIQSVCKSLNT